MTDKCCKIRDGESSNPIEHFAKSIWLNDWRTGWLLMLTACFDASGHPTQRSVLVAGFIASVPDWIDFEKAWINRLSGDGLAFFHMHEFAQSVGQFKGWEGQEIRRRKLLADLYGIIQSHAFRKFGTAILNSELDTVITTEAQQEFNISAYGLAGRGVVENVMQWASTEQIRSVEFVFEAGDLNQGHLVNLMNTDGLPIPSFKPKRDTVTKFGLMIPGFVPLQAADILAYEYRLALERDAASPARWGYEQFDKMPGEIRKFTIADLQRLKEVKVDGEVL
jgi:hypothetical protein